MKKTPQHLKEYLAEVLDLQVKMQRWTKGDTLPFFLIDTYDFYETSLFKVSFLLVLAKEDVELTPATIKKHFAEIQRKTNLLCIFVQKGTTSYNRKRLIEHRIPFIIPGNQMYLPELGIDLREYFRAVKSSKKLLSPATQALLIYVLLDQEGIALTPSKLSSALGYTVMTMSRAFDELERAGIGEVIREGKERLLHVKESKKEIWESAKLLMRDPVKKRVWVVGKKSKLLSGLSALAEGTMLAPPSTPVFAVSLNEWKKMEVIELSNQEDAAFEVEIWHYDPSLFASRGIVDPFSLYLSLKGIEDERVEITLEEMMEKIEW